MKAVLFELARALEKLAAKWQGKGGGTRSIEREIAVLAGLTGNAPALALDIGGNAGDYTAALLRRPPGLEVHVFEPELSNIARLNQRFAGSANVTVAPFAVSDHTGTASIYSDKEGSGLTSLSQRDLDHLDIRLSRVQETQLVRIEDYWRDTLGARPIDLVKLDIEGHELAALQGFGAALAQTRAIQFEFGGANIDTRTYFRDFWKFFASHGFHIFRITPLGAQKLTRYRERDEFFSTTNYIALRGGR